ncbi:MAG: trypsin-like peptidase domain-containing protein [Clostridia bacterium]|nr:trypsin-like peptidase domain-containing protein [Clostridia bacterium]
MKRNDIRRRNRKARRNTGITLFTALMLACVLAVGGAFALKAAPAALNASAEAATEAQIGSPVIDTSPAIYVAEKNANSVVGIITNTQGWDRSYGVQDRMLAQGSGVVIAEGGYVLTNYHVIEDGNAFQVLMPSGDKVDASIVGTDSNLDLAVLQVSEQADTLVPVTIGSSSAMKVGSTVVAIGNPGGEILANTVTQGIISALERSSMSGSNTTRNVDYIQHDAPINSGNSGGGLFDYQGNLIGINTLKYRGSYYSSGSYEGLGFAIPVETAYPIAQQLIQYGKVIRPQIGVTVRDYEGPDEPMNDYAPASILVASVNENGPAAQAGMKQYDFITAIDGQRVTTKRELTTLLDKYKPGDTVTVTVVRYNNVTVVPDNYNSYGNYGNYYGSWPFGFGFGFGGDNYGYGYGNNGNGNSNSGSTSGTLNIGGGYTTIDLNITLEEQE